MPKRRPTPPTITDPETVAALRRRAQLQLKLTESATDFYATLGLLDPWDLYADFGAGDSWAGYPAMLPPYYRQSQKRGEVLPVYISEAQLRMIRDRSRKLIAQNEFAICASENRRSYVAGKGLTIRATASRPDCPPALLAKVQTMIDLFGEANQLDDLASDMVLRWDRDGEAFYRTFEQPNGLLLVRPIEAEHVRSPQGDAYGPAYSFGVQTDPEDVLTVRGFWVVERPWINQQTTFVPSESVLHTKLNTDLSAKRGLPTFYAVEGNLRRCEDLLCSMTSMAKTRAKIALIRKFNGVMQSTAQNLADSLTEVTVADPSTGATLNLERLRFGSILNSSGNIEYEMPGADIDAASFVQILQADLRAVAARLVMPEWMLTVDASNANYSSSLIAEAPSTKMFERLQRLLSQSIGERRHGPRASLIWRQLDYAVRLNLLPAAIYQCVKIQVECPSLVVRDKNAESGTNEKYLKMRVKSRQTIQQENGLDTKTEDANFRADGIDPTKPEQPPAPPGMPGAGPPGIGGGANGPPTAPGLPQKTVESKDANGQEHAADGKFGTGSGNTETPPTNKTVEEPAKKEPKKFGKSKAPVKIAADSKTMETTLKQIFGKKAPAIEDLASAVGAPDDATVTVGHKLVGKKAVVTIKIEHPDFDAERYIFKNGSGIHMKNEEFFVKEASQGKGIGADIFGRQVEQCRELGINSIRCHAAKANPGDPSKPHNGYYTWPRFGYDAEIEVDNFDEKVYDKLFDKLISPGKRGEKHSLLELMETPEGRDWWKQNGSDIYHAQFDLTPGSRSLAVHEAYQAEREQKKAS